VRSLPTLEFFSFADERRKQIAEMEKGISKWSPGLAVSPDQSSILYTQVDQDVSDITLVENFR
jgi:hypothetical protein